MLLLLLLLHAFADATAARMLALRLSPSHAFLTELYYFMLREATRVTIAQASGGRHRRARKQARTHARIYGA